MESNKEERKKVGGQYVEKRNFTRKKKKKIQFVITADSTFFGGYVFDSFLRRKSLLL